MANLNVEVVIATQDRQRIVSLSVGPGTTAAEAVEKSQIARWFPEVDVVNARLGIWGREVDKVHGLRDGDRVEIYRPLKLDPREARRQLALAGKTMTGSATSTNTMSGETHD